MPTVLLVDDEPQILKLLVQLLRAEYTVITAESGIEALSIYASYSDRIDFIITDVTMPGMSGIEWVKRVEALYRRRLQVIFITGASDAPLEPTRLVVRKPFSTAVLKDAIQRTLRAEGK
jgi:CheY-like chemotaxis protein